MGVEGERSSENARGGADAERLRSGWNGTNERRNKTSGRDQWGLLVQSRLPSANDTVPGFKQIIVPEFDAAYKLARLLCGDADAAQDIVQEAFLRVHRSFAGYRGGNARAWILKIVRNCYHSWLMNRRRKSRLEVDPHKPGDTEERIDNISSDE
jgi:hypothetical protein